MNLRRSLSWEVATNRRKESSGPKEPNAEDDEGDRLGYEETLEEERVTEW